MRLLVTGFGPFPGIRANPSAALAKNLARDKRIIRAGITVDAMLIPTTWQDGVRLVDVAAGLNPDAVLMLGVAGKRRGLSVELQARNRLASFPDAAGKRASRMIISPHAPAFRRGRAPFPQLVAAASSRGIGVRLSRNAGTYLCNFAYWRMLDALPATTPCLFVHVPKLSRRGMIAAQDSLQVIARELIRWRRVSAAARPGI